MYFRSAREPDEVWATYVVVPPIAIDLAKYVPPMFASQIGLQTSTGPIAYPLPPLPEKVESRHWMEKLADSRGDDLLEGSSVDPSDLQRLMLAMAEVAQSYGALYADWAGRAAEGEPEPRPLPSDIDVEDLLVSVMSDREKVGKLAKLLGTLRYALEGADARAGVEAADDMRRVGRHLEAKYRVDALIAAAGQPGEAGWRLAQLYIERAYKLATEDYSALQGIEAQIMSLEQATGHEGR